MGDWEVQQGRRPKEGGTHVFFSIFLLTCAHPVLASQVIHVGAAAPTLPPALVAQLASPGRMFVPIGTDQQAVWLVEKDEKGEVRMKELFGVRYVPLTGREDQEGYGR